MALIDHLHPSGLYLLHHCIFPPSSVSSAMAMILTQFQTETVGVNSMDEEQANPVSVQTDQVGMSFP
jgi:hypothetical protein